MGISPHVETLQERLATSLYIHKNSKQSSPIQVNQS